METLPDEIAQGAPRVGATRMRFAVLGAACGLALVTYVHRLGFAVGAPDLKRELRLDDEQMGYLFAAFFWAYGGFQILGGWLGDRLGVRHLLTLMVFAWSLVTGAIALVVFLPGRELQFGFLLTLRFLFGAFQAGGFPLLSRINADWVPVTLRGTSQGLVWMSSRIGGALIPLILAPMFHRLGTWWPFWCLAVVGFVWCLAFWPWFRNRPEDSPLVNDAELKLITGSRPACPQGTYSIPWARLLSSRSVWALCLAYGCMGFSSNFFIGWLPSYLRNHRHFSDTMATWLTSLPLACGAIACLWGGTLSDFIIRRTGNLAWGRRLNGTISLAVAALAFGATIVVQDPILLAVLLSLTFACSDLSMAPAWAACADIGERSAGTLGGAMNMMANVGGAVAAMIAGYLFKHHQPSLVFLISSAVYVIGSLSWLNVDATKSLSATEPRLSETP